MSWRSSPVALVGRARELEIVALALDAAADGFGGALLLTGEPGIGKTRVAERAAVDAAAAGFVVAWGSGWPDPGPPALWPWDEVLAQLGCDPAELLGTGGDAAAQPFRRFPAVARAVAARSADTPVLLVLDDAHAFDTDALALARFVVRSLRVSRVLAVITARDDSAGEPERLLGELRRDATHIALGGLDTAALTSLLEGAGRPADHAAARSLAELTGGNPLLVQAALADAAGRSGVDAQVRHLLGNRLQPFVPDERGVLVALAVLGPAATDLRVAVVTNAPRATVADVRTRALATGLLRPGDAGTAPHFAHRLLQDALVHAHPVDELARLHARCAEALAAELPAPDLLARIAHHWCSAVAAGDDTLLTTAVDASRKAAAANRARGAPDSVASALRTAARLVDEQRGTVPAQLLVELGQAEFAAGRLRDSRRVFDRAVAAAIGGDPIVLAEAVLGLGGLSVFEHRGPDDVARFRSLLDLALARVPDGRADLRARLHVRAVADGVFAGHQSTAALDRAVGAVRRCGDPAAIAEALSLQHHVLLGVAHARRRRVLADELLGLAPRAGDPVHALMGQMWRTVDRFLDADPAAARALHELRQHADALRVRSVLYVVGLIDTMLLVRAGRLDTAEAEAARLFAEGVALGEADATGYYAGQLMQLRWLQDRTAEIVELARDALGAPTLQAGDEVYAAGFAAVAARAGGPAVEEARVELDRIASGGVDKIPMGSNWLVTMCCLAEAAEATGHVGMADAVHAALAPYADRTVIGSLGSLCLGPVRRVLGACARTAGRLDDALGYLEQAVDDAARVGNRPLVAICRGELGVALIERGEDQRGTALVDQAAGTLSSLGLRKRAYRLRADAEARRRDYTPTPAPEGPREHAVLRWTGSAWELAANGERALLRDAQGVRHLARLLRQPGVGIGADQLAGTSVGEARHDVIDAAARSAYLERLARLRADLDAADATGDVRRSAGAQRELDELLAHVQGQLGRGGRVRAFAGNRERARTAVQKAIRRTIANIGEQAPGLGEGLARSIRTGTVCAFEPGPGVPNRWAVHGPDGTPDTGPAALVDALDVGADRA
jgi:tetratricopeptide (TPR) repeat protein